MHTIQLYVFKHSHDPFVQLLEEQSINFHGLALNSQAAYAAGDFLQIVKDVGNATFWPSLATVIVCFLNRNSSRKVIITTEDNKTIHIEGHSPSEVEELLKKTKSIAAIQAKPTIE